MSYSLQRVNDQAYLCFGEPLDHSPPPNDPGANDPGANDPGANDPGSLAPDKPEGRCCHHYFNRVTIALERSTETLLRHGPTGHVEAWAAAYRSRVPRIIADDLVLIDFLPTPAAAERLNDIISGVPAAIHAVLMASLHGSGA
jgi:hypothetical protein